MTTWRIAQLAEHPQWVEQLAHWHHAQWGALMAPWSLDDARAELQHSASNSSAIPLTLIAFEANRDANSLDQPRLLGSVSLLASDAPEFSEYSPWLASLYVSTDARGLGIGSALVRALMAQAKQLGIPRMYLFTPGSAEIYLRQGWSIIETRSLHKQPVILMTASPFVMDEL